MAPCFISSILTSGSSNSINRRIKVIKGSIERVRIQSTRLPNYGSKIGPAKKSSLSRGKLLDSRLTKLSTVAKLRGTLESKGLNAYDAISYDPVPRMVLGRNTEHLHSGIRPTVKKVKPVLDSDNRHIVLESHPIGLKSFPVLKTVPTVQSIGKPGLVIHPVHPKLYRIWLDKHSTNNIVDPTAKKYICKSCGLTDSNLVVGGSCTCKGTIIHEFIPGYMPRLGLWDCEYMPNWGC